MTFPPIIFAQWLNRLVSCGILGEPQNASRGFISRRLVSLLAQRRQQAGLPPVKDGEPEDDPKTDAEDEAEIDSEAEVDAESDGEPEAQAVVLEVGGAQPQPAKELCSGLYRISLIAIAFGTNHSKNKKT